MQIANEQAFAKRSFWIPMSLTKSSSTTIKFVIISFTEVKAFPMITNVS